MYNVMLFVWQGARRCLSCSGQRTHQGYQLRRHCGPIDDKYQIPNREDASLFSQLRPPRRLRQSAPPRPRAITRK